MEVKRKFLGVPVEGYAGFRFDWRDWGIVLRFYWQKAEPGDWGRFFDLLIQVGPFAFGAYVWANPPE